MASEAKDISELVMTCFQCGTCSASCPVRIVVDEFNPVKISRLIILGRKEELIESSIIWLCANCGVCAERCPRGIAFVDVIMELQNEAVKRGKSPKQVEDAVKMLMEKGWIYDPEICNYAREDLGLPLMPKVKVESIKRMAKSLGLVK